MNPICVVFADAFAYGSYTALEGLDIENKLYRLTPGIAYSSNLHYQIFQGKSPDKLGVFTDFAYDMKTKKTNCSRIMRFLDRTRPLNDLYRYISHKIKKDHDNIPFSERKAFVSKGTYMFMQEGNCTVFGRECAKVYESDLRTSFEKAHHFLDSQEENIVVVLEELDRQGHVVGCRGNAYMDAAGMIVKQASVLFQHFKEKHPDGIYMLISDHGMAYVNAGINIVDLIYRTVGMPGKDYFFFHDSVYLRFWSEDAEVLKRIKKAVEQCDALCLIDQKDREKYGAANAEFGALLYRLKQGYVFDPSCFGITGHAIVTGMHGYLEHSDEASGIVVTNLDLGKDQDISACKIYDQVMEQLRR